MGRAPERQRNNTIAVEVLIHKYVGTDEQPASLRREILLQAFSRRSLLISLTVVVSM